MFITRNLSNYVIMNFISSTHEKNSRASLKYLNTSTGFVQVRIFQYQNFLNDIYALVKSNILRLNKA